MSLNPGDTITKASTSIEPYGMDWTAYLAGLIDGTGTDTIATSTWTITCTSEVSPALTITNASIVTGSLKTQMKLNGGTVGLSYTVKNSIITTAGDKDDRIIYVFIGSTDR